MKHQETPARMMSPPVAPYKYQFSHMSSSCASCDFTWISMLSIVDVNSSVDKTASNYNSLYFITLANEYTAGRFASTLSVP